MRNLFLVACAIIAITISCTKISSTQLGSGLIPPVDNVNTFDTILPVETSTFINTYDPSVYKADDHVIGALNDPIFGKTVASAYFELKPTTYPYSFAINKNYRKADSAVLILNFRGVYGDSINNPIQQWEVLEMDELLKGDTIYRVSVNPALKNGAISQPNTMIDIRRLGDSVNNKFEASINQVRIKLTQAFAERLINQYDSTQYLNDSTFRQAFKGFAVRPVTTGTGTNALVRINLADNDTKLGLYYHKDSANIKSDTSVNFFRISRLTDQTSVTANRIVRDYTGSELATSLNIPNAENVYALAAPGTFISVKIPGLQNLSNRMIHRAELMIFQEDSDNDLLAEKLLPPRYLLLSRFDSVNNHMMGVPNDFEISQGQTNLDNFGGYPYYQNIAGFTNRVITYGFNISRYVQGIVTRKDSSYNLRLSAPSNDSIKYSAPFPNQSFSGTHYFSPSNANELANGRVRLAGGSHPNERVRMRVRIIFSRI